MQTCSMSIQPTVPPHLMFIFFPKNGYERIYNLERVCAKWTMPEGPHLMKMMDIIVTDLLPAF